MSATRQNGKIVFIIVIVVIYFLCILSIFKSFEKYQTCIFDQKIKEPIIEKTAKGEEPFEPAVIIFCCQEDGNQIVFFEQSQIEFEEIFYLKIAVDLVCSCKPSSQQRG
jgi:hypothetical protein